MVEPEGRTHRRRWLSIGLFVATLAGLFIALRSASDSVGEVPWPGPPAIVTSLVMMTAAMLAAAASWAVLLGERGDHVTLARGFVYGQVGKYIPGGVVQYARLYEYGRKAGIEPRAIAIGMPVYAYSAILAPAAVAAIGIGIAAPGFGLAVRVLFMVLGAAGVVVTTYRPLAATTLDVLSRRWSRLPASDAMPSQRAIARAFVLGSVTSICFGAAYATLLGGSDARLFVAASCGFLVASAVGFAAIPFPSGLGVREAVLTALLYDIAPVAEILSAAIAVRVVQIAVDLTLAGGTALESVIRRPPGDRSASR